MWSLQYSFSLLSVILIVVRTQVQSITIPSPSGQLEGVKYLTENNTEAYAFLGIPYAEPPLGYRRFRAPDKLPPWTGVYNATYHRNICIQPESNGIVITKENENCLFLNVYTNCLPQINGTCLLPVVVWIHGGGFMSGSGNLDLNGSDRFLQKDIVVVPINYRLGVFGFLSTEDDVAPGNYGLKDQILALEWVQSNIIAFGGDPKRVTIFGQSAGAASVHYLVQSPRGKGLFHGAIANSGNSIDPWSAQRYARTKTFTIGALNGIISYNNNSRYVVSELRKVDAIQLQRSTDAPSLIAYIDVINGLPFAPTIEEPSNEAVYTEFSYEAQKKGHFNQVPILHGFNSLEVGDLSAIPWLVRLSFAQWDLFPSRLTPLDMNANISSRNIVGRNIKSYYFGNQSAQTQPGISNYLSDHLFVRAVVKSTVLQSSYCPVYLYRFSFNKYEGAQARGVPHVGELFYLWIVQGFYRYGITVSRMVQLWTNFIKYGNPTHIQTPEVNVTWPPANFEAVTYLDIGDDLVVGTNPEEEQMVLWDDQYTIYGHPPYNTY